MAVKKVLDEQTLQTLLQLIAVEIKKKAKNKGRIEIEYYSMEELERLIELINRLK